MSFKDLNLKPCYDSREDDILNSFYIPVLSNAKQYLRLCGFFSSTSLALASKGISKLIENNGQMKIVTSPKLTKEDVNAILEGYKKMSEVIEEKMSEELDKFENEIIRDHVKALAWMVAHKKLDIKVVILKNVENNILDYQTINKRGIFHQKVGILKDHEGNMVSFSGSINETASGWLENIEEFKVFRSWTKGELPYLLSDVRKFKKYWLGSDRRIEVLTIPKAVRKKFIEIAPPDISELKLIERVIPLKIKSRIIPINVEEEKFTLRDYQKKAVERWIANNYKGIVEMATGTGKTYVAIQCLKKILKKDRTLFAVIVVPTTHLVTQWKDSLEEFGFKNIIKIFGSHSSWKKKLKEKIDEFDLEYVNTLLLITTYDTFCSTHFIKQLHNVDNANLFLVADEVHAAGSPQRSKGLLSIYKYRLGLSATPERWYDPKGTKLLIQFFGSTVFRYTLKEAVKDGWLSPYKYYPIFVELEDDELAGYIKISKKISRLYHLLKDKDRREEILQRFYIMRSNILKNARGKIKKFEELIRKLIDKNELEYCLVYCPAGSSRQLQQVQRVLNKYDVLQHKFTASEKIKERERILRLFKKGEYKVLVAMKCLDEGVNIPSIKIAIILASTTNPREFVQRRGRILRKVVGKIAVIYDFIVVPTFNPDKNSEYFELERKILKERELPRYMEFANAALNSGEAIRKIKMLREKYLV
ncbi:MAG: DEAD/DEAH box helicase family protein [Candidatus Aenigmarchaeota archaeon]|nr:DEAD/DEAH box helicase family protein [Candidatus Aenigmarchaeota archaeon]